MIFTGVRTTCPPPPPSGSAHGSRVGVRYVKNVRLQLRLNTQLKIHVCQRNSLTDGIDSRTTVTEREILVGLQRQTTIYLIPKNTMLSLTMHTSFTLCTLGNFSWFVSKSTFSTTSNRNTIRVSNGFDPYQARRFVGLDLCPNCLEKY